MPVFRWGNAFEAFRDLEMELDRMARTVASVPFRSGRLFPAVNLYERPEEFLVVAALPGVEKESLDVSVAEGVLTLSGERTRPADVPEAQYRRSERPVGRFERAVTLPERVVDGEIAADFRLGILRLRLPKTVPPPARKISVTHDEEPPAGLIADSSQDTPVRTDAGGRVENNSRGSESRPGDRPTEAIR